MSHTFTLDPTPAFPSGITVPDDGDLESAASVNVPIEGIANAVARVNWPATNVLKEYPLAVRNIQRAFGMLDAHALPRPDFSGSPSWVPDVGARWRQNDTTSTNALYYPLDGLLPGACTLDEIHVYLTGSAGHGALPGTMPRWVLNRRALATGIDTAVQTQPDASGTTGAYQARHTIDGDGIDETIDRTSHSYYLEIDGEYGTNSQDGLLVDSIKILYHVDHVDEGAA